MRLLLKSESETLREISNIEVERVSTKGSSVYDVYIRCFGTSNSSSSSITMTSGRSAGF